MARLVGPLAALAILAMGCGPALAVQAMDDGPFYAVKGSTLKIKISDLLANDLPANGQKVLNRVFKIKNMASIQSLFHHRHPISALDKHGRQGCGRRKIVNVTRMMADATRAT
jgi:hypothetical protein